jgi:putative intracellular protease/amidase
MTIAILLYDNMTALDAIGPYEVLSRLPGARVQFVASAAGPLGTDTGFLRLVADFPTSDVRQADVLVVPGGPGDERVRQDATLLEWIRTIDASSQWTTSVCTGSLILGAAGLLGGLKATTHWTRLELLREFGAQPTHERVVQQGKIVTAAGVSSGIDMALRLTQLIAGDDLARAIQLGIEYDPAPPIDSGSPAKAPAHIVELVRGVMARRTAERSS